MFVCAPLPEGCFWSREGRFRDGWEGLTWSMIILINDELTFEVFTALHMQEIGTEAILLHFLVRRRIPER